MAKQLARHCFLCDAPLAYRDDKKRAIAEGLPLKSGNTHRDSKSDMHYGHHGKNVRAEFKFLGDDCWKSMGVKSKRGYKTVCYECHEVVCHNPVFNEEMLEQLAQLFQGRTFAEKVKILNRVIAQGLAAELSSIQKKSLAPITN